MKTNGRQFVKIIHHNKSMYDPKWFRKGQCISIVFKDIGEDGSVLKKMVKHYPAPTIRYYVTKPDHQEKYPLRSTYIPADHCDQYESKLNELDYHIAQLTDNMDFYEETKGPGSKKARRELHRNRFLHGTDAALADHYIDRFLDALKDNHRAEIPLTKAYADIEVDGVEHEGVPSQDLAPCPINIIGLYYQPNKTIYQFALRNAVRENPLIQEFEDNLDTHKLDMIRELNKPRLINKKLIDANISDVELNAKLGLDYEKGVRVDNDFTVNMRCLEVDIKFYDTEAECILAMLDFVNETLRPDVLAWWNMRFDIKTIINRLKKLDIDYEKAFSANDFNEWPIANYYEDLHHSDYAEINDSFTVASYTEYVDQMLLYAALRKSSGKKESYALDYTLENEINERKLEIDSIKTLPYTNYAKFVLYNAFDIIPMATLEDSIGDISLAYFLSVLTRTQFTKVMKKTIALRNFANYFLRDSKGLILSNNHNRLEENFLSEKFEGAYVLPPSLVSNVGMVLDGVRSNRIFETTIDFDAKSLYPSIWKILNLDQNSLIGKVSYLEGNISIQPLMETIIAGDPYAIGVSFGLPTISELLEKENIT